MPAACAFLATAEPTSLFGASMMSTLTPLLIIPSARVENFCTSPWAFWMSGSMPSARSALSSSGLSKLS